MAIEEQTRPASPWMTRLGIIVFALFCIELGIFLLLYPWSQAWNRNRFFYLKPQFRPFLLSEQFRGAVSGLGVLNLVIGILELFRLRRTRSR